MAREIGLLTGVAFPLFAPSGVLGVLELFSTLELHENFEYNKFLFSLGGQMGMFLDHARNFASLDLMHPKKLLDVDFGEEAVLTIDSNSQILFASVGVSTVFGYAPEEMLMQPLSILIPKELQEAHANGLARYIATGAKHIPWTGVKLPAIKKDRTRFVAELSFGEFSRQGRRIFTGFARPVES